MLLEYHGITKTIVYIVWMFSGIPMEEEEEDQDTSIKGRLMALVNKIKGQPHKAEMKPTEKEQAIPCKNHLQSRIIIHGILLVFICL